MQPSQRPVFVRHRGPVTCAAGIPGTQRVVTSGYDGAVGLFDLGWGKADLIGYHQHLANRVTVNAAGSRAASASSDYTVILWNLATRKPVRVLRGHADDVEDFVFINDRLGASVSRDWRLLLWDLDTGAIVRVFDGHEKDALSVVYHDGKLITSGDDMTLRVWDIETGRQLRMWGPFESETDTCAVDPLHDRVVLGCDDGVIRAFDLNTGAWRAEVPAHSSGIKKVAVSPRTGDILSAAYDQKVRIWDAASLRPKTDLAGQRALWERSLNWTADGTQILAGTFDGTVLAWDAQSGKLLQECGGDGNREGNACFNEAAALDADTFALVSDDGYVRLARLSPGEAAWALQLQPAAGRTLMNAVAADGRLGVIAAGAHNHKLHLFHRGSGSSWTETATALGQGPINSIRIARHAGHAGVCFAACYSGAVVQVSPEGQAVATFRPHENAVKALRLHPTERLGVSCSADGSLVSWDFQGNIVNRFLGHTAIIDDVDIDPSGRLIASTGRDFTLKIYDLHAGRMRHTVGLGRRSPKALCFIDPHTVVVANYWGELYRFDLETQQLTRRQVARNGISSVVPAGQFVVATSYDGGVYLVNSADLRVHKVLRAMTQRVDQAADDAGETP